MRQGFTFVEMLVVIAIIASLAALLFPVLASAKKKSLEASCVNNLRQIYSSNALYVADSDDVFPSAKDCPDVLDPTSFPWRLQLRLLEMPMLSDALAPYGAKGQIWKCPADSGVYVYERLQPHLLNAVPSAYSYCGMSYEYHTALGLANISMSSIQHPSEATLLSDLAGHWHSSESALMASDPPEEVGYKLFGYRYCLVFIDGHAKCANSKEAADGWSTN